MSGLKRVAIICFIAGFQLLAPQPAHAMEEVVVYGYRIVYTFSAGVLIINAHGPDDAAIEFMSNVDELTDLDEGEPICALYGNPDGTITFLEYTYLYSAVGTCLAGVAAAEPATVGAATFLVGGCAVVSQGIYDSICSD